MPSGFWFMLLARYIQRIVDRCRYCFYIYIYMLTYMRYELTWDISRKGSQYNDQYRIWFCLNMNKCYPKLVSELTMVCEIMFPLTPPRPCALRRQRPGARTPGPRALGLAAMAAVMAMASTRPWPAGPAGRFLGNSFDSS